MQIIDFTNCEDGYRKYEGSDNKRSIEYNGEKYLLKLPEHRFEKANDFQNSSVNNVFSEYIGSHIFRSAGIDVHDTLLGMYYGKPAVACRDFTGNGYVLQEFSWMMVNVYDISQVKRFPTYKQLYEVHDQHPLLRKIKDASLDRYWDTFIVDALIGNFDRHKVNWGYLVNEKLHDIKLAPVYDCGSSLYPNLDERKMDYVLSSREEIEKRIYMYPMPALNRNDNPGKEEKFHYDELMSSHMDKKCTQALFRVYPRIHLSDINNIIENTPFLSAARINFYEKMIAYRKEYIHDRARDILISKVMEEISHDYDGDLHVVNSPYKDNMLIGKLVLPHKENVFFFEDGTQQYYGDKDVCIHLRGRFGGDMEYSEPYWSWHSEGNFTDKEVNEYVHYCVKALNIKHESF